MYNLLIDPLPKEYEGYLIKWQFYNGILISECLSDTEIFSSDEQGQIERIYTAFTLLFGNGIPTFDVALSGLKWFLSCGASEEKTEENSDQSEQYFSFEDDRNRLFSAFMVKYGINLNKADDLHFFEFIALMNDLHKTSFRNVVDIRMMGSKDMKNYSREQKQEIIALKRKFAIKKALEQQYTDEQKRAIDHFERLIGLKT